MVFYQPHMCDIKKNPTPICIGKQEGERQKSGEKSNDKVSLSLLQSYFWSDFKVDNFKFTHLSLVFNEFYLVYNIT